MNKKLVKQQQSISMEKFLRNYCHLENDYLIDMLSALSHKELKEMCREIYKLKLMTLPFEEVSTEDINSGEVLFVSDAFYNPAPYKNPLKENVREIFSQPVNKERTKDLENEEKYEDIIDAIEDNFGNENVDISSIGSFNLPKVRRKK